MVARPGRPVVDPVPVADSGDPWTRLDVERWLKVAFAQMVYTPIYAPRADRNTLESSRPATTPSATFDIVAFSGTVLGDKSIERKVVLVWARSTAARDTYSIAEFCRSRNPSMHLKTFQRIRIRACERIAAAKNLADGRTVIGSAAGPVGNPTDPY